MKLKLTWLMTLFMAFAIQFSYAQEKTVTGTVTAASDGLPLPGASVVVKGTTRGVQTDFDGGYSIKVNVGEVLVFSYVGMESSEVKVGTSNTYNVAMNEDTATLDEVVVVAYGTQDKSKVIGASSRVSAEELEQIPMASFDQILQGRASGVQISSGSGQPGTAARVRIRGNGSINGSNEPLYIMDGMQISAAAYASLNPNDFEDVTILKDAVSVAPYGSRGANGVIVITSKKGSFDQKTTFSYKGLYGVSEISDPNFEMMNSRELLEFQRLIGRGAGAGLSDAQIAELAKTNTDWSDYFFRTGTTNSHELSMSGGSEKSRFYSSFGYFEQEGVSLRSDLKRFTLRNNYEIRPDDKTKIGLNTQLGFSKSNFIDSENSVTLQNPYAAVYLASPYDAPYDEYGQYATGGGKIGANALENLKENGRGRKEFKFVGGVFAERELFKNITARLDLGVDYTQRDTYAYADPNTYFGSTTEPGGEGFYSESNGYYAYITSTSRLSYENTFADKHNLKVSAFLEYLKYHSNTNGFTGYGINPNLVGYPGGISEGTPDNELIPSVSGTNTERGLFSYFAIANYDYDNRFGLDLSIRRDASSKFSNEHQWGTFYSVGARWNVSREAFMENVDFINDLKLRASYGTSGNQDAISDFAYATEYGQISYNGQTGIAVGRLGNPELKWETSNTFNVGLDFELLDYRIKGSVEYYNNKTTDLFVDYTLSAVSGATSISSNAGSMRNAGIDANIDVTVFRNQENGLEFGVFGNLNYNKNEILDLGQVSEFELGTSIIREGLPLGSHYVVGWAGVNPANGEPLYYDLDGNVTNVYSESNSTAKWGSYNPVYTGGFGARFSYKGFELSTLFSYAADYFRFNNQTFFQENPNFAQYNLLTNMNTMWQQPGDVTEVQSYLYAREFSSKDIEDASFTKWRNLTISYNLPSKYLEKTKFINAMKIYVQGQNLYTWTKFTGFDPEDDNNIAQYEYPTPRIFSMGVNIEF